MIRTALALGIVLEVIEIFRRAPAWLLMLAFAVVAQLVSAVIAYFWWIAGALVMLGLRQTGRRFAQHEA
jgi:hypothetical protein